MTQPTAKPLPCLPGDPYVLVPLHQYPEFTFPCATLLNMEWPRSRQSRLNGLWSCSRQFPVAMVLVECESRSVVGFCKVSLIPGTPKACFIQSVVIHPEKRGQGLGSFLMTNLEEYLRGRRLRTLYLSTLGQEKFYSKLGYEECEPISSLHAFGLQSKQEENNVEKPVVNSNLKKGARKKDGSISTVKTNQSMKLSKISTCSSLSQPVSPPPPPPLPSPKGPFGVAIMTIKTFMKKEIEQLETTTVQPFPSLR